MVKITIEEFIMNKIRKAVIDINGEWPSKEENECYLVLGDESNNKRCGEYDCLESPFDCLFTRRLYKSYTLPWIDICSREQFEEEVKKWKEESNMSTHNTKHQKFSGSLGEFAERYIHGETFYQLDASQAYEISKDLPASYLKHYYESGVLEKVNTPWYESLGDGVLCWVMNEDGEEFSALPFLIDAYYEDATYKYSNANAAFFDAKPLTKEEALRFVLGE